MKAPQIITPDMPEALKEVKNMTIYFSRHGKGFADEQRAREDGATHYKCNSCESGIVEKGRSMCPDCINKRSEARLQEKIEQWEKLQEGEAPEGYTMLYDIVSEDFIPCDDDEIIDYCKRNDFEICDLKLVFAEKTTLSTIDYDLFNDSIHEDHDYSKEFDEKLKAFNEFLTSYDTQTYEAPRMAYAKKYSVDYLTIE